ncbi:rhodanese-like domain-containing protein [Kutzneria sp. NPDC052558]|uniref:rhodanese-like domain-containing protein n=1 Tax=Kutzneria sp. NPDC052558 TaxID=3364121 RepID=UPI0037C82AAC
MSRYVIIGAGAVGATLAAELRSAGLPVVVVARGANLDALRSNGLRYIRPDGERRVELDVVGGPAEVELAQDDVLVLATKSQDTEEVTRAWAHAAHLPIVVVQNGLENERVALRRFEHVYGAVVWVPSSHLRPGEVVSPGEPAAGALQLGRYPGGVDDRIHAIAEDFAKAGLITEVVPDIQRWKAGKLFGNLVNGLDALYRPSPLRAAADRALRREARIALAAFEPTRYSPGLSIATIPGHERGGSSTWQSLTRGAPPETDYLNGEIVLQARLNGHRAPYNEALIERLRRAGDRPPGTLDDADLLATLPDLARRDVLVTASELHDLIEAGAAPTLLDVRWALGDPDGHRHYLDGHIPGAVYVDLDTELAGHGEPADGRHPLPDIAALQAAARRWGVTTGKAVVAYDNSGGTAAARAWWLLKWAGVEDVRLLDGGLDAWRRKRSTVDVHPQAGDIVLTAGNLPTLTADQAASVPVLLDARAAERYRGEVEPVDPRAGHIPGAISVPTAGNLAADGTFRTTEELRRRFAAFDGEVGVYCGSGVTAAHEIAALAVAGIPAALYPGSWSAWSNDPSRPVEVGE